MKEWIVRDTLNNKYVQELVRCKDCKYGESVKNARGEPMIECALCNELWLKKPDWFCADGERG